MKYLEMAQTALQELRAIRELLERLLEKDATR